MIAPALVVLVAHTYREEEGEAIVRIVSARKAAAFERKAYEEGEWPLR
jgi:uncharacterized protein